MKTSLVGHFWGASMNFLFGAKARLDEFGGTLFEIYPQDNKLQV